MRKRWWKRRVRVEPVALSHLTVWLAAVPVMLALPGALGVAILVTGEEGSRGAEPQQESILINSCELCLR